MEIKQNKLFILKRIILTIITFAVLNGIYSFVIHSDVLYIPRSGFMVFIGFLLMFIFLAATITKDIVINDEVKKAKDLSWTLVIAIIPFPFISFFMVIVFPPLALLVSLAFYLLVILLVLDLIIVARILLKSKNKIGGTFGIILYPAIVIIAIIGTVSFFMYLITEALTGSGIGNI